MSTMPALFISHGAPPLVDNPTWVSQLKDLAAGLPRPTAILMASAHWESAPLMLGGWLLSAKALAPKFSKLDPVAGVGRMFSAQALSELFKALAKSLLIGGVAVVASLRGQDHKGDGQASAGAHDEGTIGCVIVIAAAIAFGIYIMTQK